MSCGKPLAHLYGTVKNAPDQPAREKLFLQLGVHRYCCKQTLMTYHAGIGFVINETERLNEPPHLTSQNPSAVPPDAVD